MGTILTSPLNLFDGFPNRYWLQWTLLPDTRSEASHNCHGEMLILYWLQWTFCWLQWMFAVAYLKASCTLLITVNVKVELRLLTALRMYTGLVHDCLRSSRRSRRLHSLSLSWPGRHALIQNRIASVYWLLTIDYWLQWMFAWLFSFYSLFC